MAFIGNPGPMPTENALEALRDTGDRDRGAKSRAACVLTSFAALMIASISFFSDRQTFPGFAFVLSGIVVVAAFVAFLRSPRNRRRSSVLIGVVGLIPAIAAAVLLLTHTVG